MLPRKKTKSDNEIVGIVVGIIIPILTFFIFYMIKHSDTLFWTFVDGMEGKILTKIVSLCTLPDLGIFYLFLNRKMNRSAKGVIISVFVIILWVIYMKYA